MQVKVLQWARTHAKIPYITLQIFMYRLSKRDIIREVDEKVIHSETFPMTFTLSHQCTTNCGLQVEHKKTTQTLESQTNLNRFSPCAYNIYSCTTSALMYKHGIRYEQNVT